VRGLSLQPRQGSSPQASLSREHSWVRSLCDDNKGSFRPGTPEAVWTTFVAVTRHALRWLAALTSARRCARRCLRLWMTPSCTSRQVLPEPHGEPGSLHGACTLHRRCSRGPSGLWWLAAIPTCAVRGRVIRLRPSPRGPEHLPVAQLVQARPQKQRRERALAWQWALRVWPRLVSQHGGAVCGSCLCAQRRDLLGHPGQGFCPRRPPRGAALGRSQPAAPCLLCCPLAAGVCRSSAWASCSRTACWRGAREMRRPPDGQRRARANEVAGWRGDAARRLSCCAAAA
jgi:hypothetical protein